MLLGDSSPDAFRGERQLANVHAGGLLDGRADCGRYPEDAAFSLLARIRSRSTPMRTECSSRGMFIVVGNR